ncbi:ferredoxin--NADP reductase [Cupriavidus sp. D384]|uniref:ferredoxin--NADP reductase n=1 Tax=Cupriavidus sp. D384 TaxID=1538095 RepID=UPI000835130C|nr:ferredoxin--NADP reductase [Cupriavidus sp. D384]
MQFHQLAVAEVIKETEDAHSYALFVPDSLQAMFRYKSGQHLTFRVNVDGESLSRSYSLSSSPETDGPLVVTVKRIARGRASNWFHAHVKQGTMLDVSAPTGRFVCDGTDMPLVFCAAGSGITPVISMIRSALATTQRNITLYYANRDIESVIFRQVIDNLAEAHSHRLTLVMHYDARDGFPNADALAALFATTGEFQLYLCGPAPFMATVQQAADLAGIPTGRVHVERFDAAPASSVEAADLELNSDIACDAQVTLGGTTHVLRVDGGQSVLHAALAAGLDVPYACEEGYCGSCAAKCVEGKVAHVRNDVFNADDLAAGWILTCQSHPRGDGPLAVTFDV